MRRHQALGLEFYEKYPTDARRWEWLEQAVKSADFYADPAQAAQAIFFGKPEWIKPDTEAQQKWEHVYESELKPAFLAAAEVSHQRRARLLLNDCMRKLHSVKSAVLRGESILEPSPLPELVRSFAEYGAQPEFSEGALGQLAGGLLYELDLLLPQDQRASVRAQVLALLKGSGNPQMQQMAAGQELLASFQLKPFTLRGKALDGREVDLAAMRDKIVLVDMWSTTCSGCIAAMPHLKEIYEKYRSHGFEVVGVCFNSEEDRPEIEGLMAKMSIPWPQLLQGRAHGPNKSKLWTDLGLSYMPVLLLIGHDGKVITNDLYPSQEKVEPAVRQALGLPPLP